MAFSQDVLLVPQTPLRIPDVGPSRRSGRGALHKARRSVWAGVMRLTRPARRLGTAWAGQQARLLPSPKHLPSHLRERAHDDYPFLFAWMPRSWTSFDWGSPRMVIGNQRHFLGDSPKPIGEPGSFQISRFPSLPFPLSWVPLYFCFTTPNGIHLRLGARWDDIDDYTQVPTLALKRNVKK